MEIIDWESFPKNRKGHDALVNQLLELIKSKYHLRCLEFDEKEAAIAERHGQRPRYYVAHKPDLIIADEQRLESRIFIEYVNTPRSYLRDLRGMLALSTLIKHYKGFVLAIRHSIFPRIWSTALSLEIPVEIMSLKSLLFALDKQDLDYLVGKRGSLNGNSRA
ncbi:MAG: hypothetical protein QW270_01915 [Candidatus Bathyarchaeia archaeon]